MFGMFNRRAQPVVVVVASEAFDEIASALPARVDARTGTLDMTGIHLARGPERESGEMAHDALAEHRRRVISNTPAPKPNHPCG